MNDKVIDELSDHVQVHRDCLRAYVNSSTIGPSIACASPVEMLKGTQLCSDRKMSGRG